MNQIKVCYFDEVVCKQEKCNWWNKEFPKCQMYDIIKGLKRIKEQKREQFKKEHFVA